MQEQRYAVIGAGPSGLAAARALQRAGIAFDGFEASRGVGGLWDIDNPRSTMYESAHLISSRTTTEFAEFPMDSTADYPEPPHASAVLPRLRRPVRTDRGVPLRHQGHIPRAGRRRRVDAARRRTRGHDRVPLRGRDPRERHPRRAECAGLPRRVHRRAAAHERVQECEPAGRQARAHHRRGQLGVRHRGRRRALRGIRRHERAPRVLLRPALPVRAAVRHAQPGQAPARAHQAVRRQAGPAGVHRRPGALRLPRSPTTSCTSRTRSSTRSS